MPPKDTGLALLVAAMFALAFGMVLLLDAARPCDPISANCLDKPRDMMQALGVLVTATILGAYAVHLLQLQPSARA